MCDILAVLPIFFFFSGSAGLLTVRQPDVRQQAMAELLKRKDARQAHPSFEHLLPIHIGAGAAGEDLGKRLWTLEEGSMSWAQYRFGEVSVA